MVLDGNMRRLSANVGSSAGNVTMVNSITLLPDDGQVAFPRRIEGGGGESALIVMKTDGAGERKLLTRGATERVDKPSWSPDGKWIACAYSSPQHRPATPATAFRTAVAPVEGGEPKIVFDSLLGSPENDFGGLLTAAP